MRDTKVISFANNKGGSGKSTTCANVGTALAAEGYAVLLLDGDMQMNLTLSFLPEEKALTYAKSGKNLYAAIKEQKPLHDFILSTDYPNLSLIPSSTLMSGIEYDLFTRWQRELILRNALQPIRESGLYDYILLDAPPTLGGWVMNILCASDYVIIPVEASPWGIFGLANMVDFVSDVQKIIPSVEILGIAITKADLRKNYFRETLSDLQRQSALPLFDSVIHIDSAVEHSQDLSIPVVAYKKGSRSAKEYNNLAKEIVQNVRR